MRDPNNANFLGMIELLSMRDPNNANFLLSRSE